MKLSNLVVAALFLVPLTAQADFLLHCSLYTEALDCGKTQFIVPSQGGADFYYASTQCPNLAFSAQSDGGGFSFALGYVDKNSLRAIDPDNATFLLLRGKKVPDHFSVSHQKRKPGYSDRYGGVMLSCYEI